MPHLMRVLTGEGVIMETVVRDVADDGSLIVAQHGRDVALSSGEISLRGIGK